VQTCGVRSFAILQRVSLRRVSLDMLDGWSPATHLLASPQRGGVTVSQPELYVVLVGEGA
jgi:hypothetical protein